MSMLSDGMNKAIIEEEFKKTRVDMLVNYFTMNLHLHGSYAIKYIICEVMNFINVVSQIHFVDRFLGYEFSTYGRQIIEFTLAEVGTRHDPMEVVFPKVTKCTFHKYGTSGTIETHDGLCVLPLNILNEKIYIILWFWLIVLATISGVGLVYRIATFSKSVRNKIMAYRCPLNEKLDLEIVNHKSRYGDWFLLHRLTANGHTQTDHGGSEPRTQVFSHRKRVRSRVDQAGVYHQLGRLVSEPGDANRRLLNDALSSQWSDREAAYNRAAHR
ncbi:Innexin [Trinorchestia longiramus]|nr:Innexin [Trinorchestia longiramus]